MDRRGAPGILFLRAGGLWPEWTSFLLLARQDTRRGLSWPAWPNHTSAQPEEAGPEKGAGSYLLSPLEILTFHILNPHPHKSKTKLIFCLWFLKPGHSESTFRNSHPHIFHFIFVSGISNPTILDFPHVS